MLLQNNWPNRCMRKVTIFFCSLPWNQNTAISPCFFKHKYCLPFSVKLVVCTHSLVIHTLSIKGDEGALIRMVVSKTVLRKIKWHLHIMPFI